MDFAVDNEMQFIAAILATGDVVTPRAAGVEPTWLRGIQAQRALAAIYEYGDDPAHPGLVPGRAYLEQLAIGGIPEHFSGAGDLASLTEALRLAELKSRLTRTNADIARMSATDPIKALQLLQEAAGSPELAGMMSTGTRTSLSQDAPQIIDTYFATKGGSGLQGLRTPYPTLDRMTKGILPGQFWVIYAPEKNYKTWIALEFVRVVYELGLRVLVVSSEMTPMELNQRLLCSILQLDFSLFRDRMLPAHVEADLAEEKDTFQFRAETDIVHFSPASSGVKAVEEVRAEIIKQNRDGKLGLVLWDGHYRSAADEEWASVWNLVRRTRQVALDPRTRLVPILVTTQEGSKKGVVGYRAYAQEASVQMFLEKQPGGFAKLSVNRIREAVNEDMMLQTDFTRCRFPEAVGFSPTLGNSNGGFFGG